MTDVTTMLLVHEENLAHRLIAPEKSAYDLLSDKAKLLEQANLLGIEAPRSVVVNNIADAERAVRAASVPIVVKPARSRYINGGQVCSTGVRIAQNSEEALAIVRSADWLGSVDAIIQEYVIGTGAGVFWLFHHGAPVAWFSHHRIREKPPRGGVSVLSESVAADSQLVKQSAALLSSVGWHGVAMVEYRLSHDGRPILMEVNGRFWGSLQLAIDAGVDFPWLLVKAQRDDATDVSHAFEIGRKLHWTLGDLDSLLIQLRDRDERRSIAKKMAAIWQFSATCMNPNARSEVFRLADPGPGFMEAYLWVKAAIHSASRR
jgi:predicted ATP-grasp superfamily ATP-dependent carboligase